MVGSKVLLSVVISVAIVSRACKLSNNNDEATVSSFQVLSPWEVIDKQAFQSIPYNEVTTS